MMPNSDLEREFSSLFLTPTESAQPAPSSMKARLYSAFVRMQQQSGPLASLTTSVSSGYGVCVFEKLVQIAPVGERAKSAFFCEICHARVLGEHFDNPPIFWHHCPYVR